MAESSSVERMTATSLTFLGRLRSGDAHAWRVFCQIYTPCVWRWSAQMSVPVDDRDDLVQDVFRRVYQALDRFDWQQQGSFRAWLKTITRNLARDRHRHERFEARSIGGTDALQRAEAVPDAAASDELEDEVDERDVEQQTLRHVDLGLNSQHCRVVELMLTGIPSRDVADQLGLTQANVLKIMSRARAQARDFLNGLWPGHEIHGNGRG